MWDTWQITVVVLLGVIFGALMDIRKTLLNLAADYLVEKRREDPN